MMPMPPARARAMARRASVTVSMAADTIGMPSSICGVRRVAVLTSPGSDVDSAGTQQHVVEREPFLGELRRVARALVAGKGARRGLHGESLVSDPLSASYHWTPEEFRRHGHEVVEWVARYLETVEELPVQSPVAPGWGPRPAAAVPTERS